MIFVDSSAWYAYVEPSDIHHERAADWYGNHGQDLLTTDYVVDEVLTLMRARNKNHRAVELGARLFASEFATLIYLTPKIIDRAWQVVRQFSDKKWSFTDCTSKIVMEEMSITTAFSFDHHFRQFGNITVVP